MLIKADSLYPVEAAFSRQQIHQTTGVPDDVLGYWLREGLIVPLPAEARKHRRFGFYQLHVAAVLDAMRRLGANISVLRAFASAFHRGAEIALTSGLARDQLQSAASLASKLDRFHSGKEVRVFTPEWEEWLLSDRSDRARYEGDSHKVAETEEEVIFGQRVVEHHMLDGFEPVPAMARKLRGEDWRALGMYLDLVSEDFVRERHQDLNWVWLAWLDDQSGCPRVLDGEDGNFSMYDSPPVFGFYISVSRLIRRLWLPQPGGQE